MKGRVSNLEEKHPQPIKTHHFCFTLPYPGARVQPSTQITPVIHKSTRPSLLSLLLVQE